MSEERKAILVTVIFGIIDILFKLMAVKSQIDYIMILSSIFSVTLLFVITILWLKYKDLAHSYEFIKFLFFGSEYNKFNFFPKLKLYMDYLGDRNHVDVETIEFECFSDNIEKYTYITWNMKNIYNNTKKEIKSYHLYTTSELGTTKKVNVEVKEGNRSLKIDVNNIKLSNGIQKTPFTFSESIKPSGIKPEIKINMIMYDAFDFNRQETIYLYPRNYGKKVKHINILLKTKGVENISVCLHEIKKDKKSYVDEPIKYGVADRKDKITTYEFKLDDKEINISSLYYLLIKPLVID